MDREHGDLVICPSCVSSTTLILAADGTYRCRYCAKPITFPEGLAPAAEAQPQSTVDISGLLCAVAVFAICVLFLPIAFWLVVSPFVVLLCIGMATDRDQEKKPASEDASIV